MDENNVMKISHIVNLPTLNIKSQLNMNIDSNTHIKQVLNIETCLMEWQTEPMSNKTLIKGAIGVKVIYVDTDNIFNTLSDTVNFSESLTNDNISNDSQIDIYNHQFTTTFDNDERQLHINIDGTIDCTCNTNNILNSFVSNNNSLVTKKSMLPTQHRVQQINKSCNYDFDFKFDSKINKILSFDSKLVIDDTKCCDGYIVITGQIFNTIVCEIENESNVVKLINNSTNFKCEIEANSCNGDCCTDLNAFININATQITTDINDNGTHFNFDYVIVVNGNLYGETNLDIVDDVYSTENHIETVSNKYKICKKLPYLKFNESVDSEITLSDDVNIDEILGIINTHSNITRYIVKSDVIIVEGVINGNLLYLDENRQIKHLETQIPYSLNIKQSLKDEICAIKLSAIPTMCKCKIKRGNTLMVDYELCVCGNLYSNLEVEIIENVKYGKAFDYNDIAFQIYIARPEETMWNLCKRLHVKQEQLLESNKETPTTYAGGEKIIIYR